MPIFTNRRGKRYELPPAAPYHTPTGIADLSLSNAKYRHILMVFQYCDGDIQWASRELGVSRETLYALVRKHNPDFKREDIPRCAKLVKTQKCS